jgi:hypothetical protein
VQTLRRATSASELGRSHPHVGGRACSLRRSRSRSPSRGEDKWWAHLHSELAAEWRDGAFPFGFMPTSGTRQSRSAIREEIIRWQHALRVDAEAVGLEGPHLSLREAMAFSVLPQSPTLRPRTAPATPAPLSPPAQRVPLSPPAAAAK